MIQSKDQTEYNYSIAMGLSGQSSEYIENNYEQCGFVFLELLISASIWTMGQWKPVSLARLECSCQNLRKPPKWDWLLGQIKQNIALEQAGGKALQRTVVGRIHFPIIGQEQYNFKETAFSTLEHGRRFSESNLVRCWGSSLKLIPEKVRLVSWQDFDLALSEIGQILGNRRSQALSKYITDHLWKLI